MYKFKDLDARKELSSIFIKLAEKIEQDEEFAKWIFEGTGFAAKKKSGKTKLSSGDQSKSKQAEISSLPDIFDIFSKQGVESLREQLKNLEPEFLKKIVKQNGLDPSGKVRRWKTKDKIVAFIVEVVSKQMSKGSAFLNR